MPPTSPLREAFHQKGSDGVALYPADVMVAVGEPPVEVLEGQQIIDDRTIGCASFVEGASLHDCRELIADGLAGWRNEPSFHGPALAILENRHSELIGQVGLGDRGKHVVELVYGVAPRHRGHGYASAAVSLIAN